MKGPKTYTVKPAKRGHLVDMAKAYSSGPENHVRPNCPLRTGVLWTEELIDRARHLGDLVSVFSRHVLSSGRLSGLAGFTV
jgi:hypothetical protein